MNKIYIFINSNNWSTEYECKVFWTKESAISYMKKNLHEEIGKFALDEGYIPFIKEVDECTYTVTYATEDEIMCQDTLDTVYYKVVEVDYPE